MVATRFLILAVATLVSAAFPEEDHYFASLLKRQEPGSASYNCHDNCGSAITMSRGSDVCSNEAFTNNYKNCLQCSGPDNFNIWRMYGTTLSRAGQACSLSTTPQSGKQPDVGPAQKAGSSSGSSSSSSSAPSTSAASSSSTESAAITPSASSTPAPTSTVGSTAAPTISGAPSISRNSTSSFPSSTPPAQQTANAALGLQVPHVAGTIGAMAMGIVFGFAN